MFRLSFSAEYISTLAWRLASHCFFLCRHFKAAMLYRLLAKVMPISTTSDLPVAFKEVSALFLVGHFLTIAIDGIHVIISIVAVHVFFLMRIKSRIDISTS